MELAQTLGAARRWWWLLLAATLLAGATAYGVSRRLTPLYRAQATLIINLSNQQLPTYQDVIAGQTIATTYAHVVTARPTLAQAATRLGHGITPETVSGVQAAVIPQSELIQVSFEAADPAFAAQVVNTVAQVAIEQVQTLQAGDASAAANVTGNSMQLLEPAGVPTTPVSPNTKLDALLGALVGLVGASLVALLLNRLDDSIREPYELAALGVTTLTAVPRSPRPRQGPLTVLSSAVSASFTESFRQLEVNLEFAGLRSGPCSLVVASARPGEGKTTTACNLAVTLAQSGRRVVLVDADLYRPAVHNFFGLPNAYGVSSTLLATNSAGGALSLLQTTPVPNLRILAAGPRPQDPATLLISPRMQELMASLKTSSDLIIYDSHTSSTAAEVTALAAGADAILAVVHAGRTRRRALMAAVGELRRSHKPILGAVLNLVSNSRWPSILGEPREPIAVASLPPASSADPDYNDEPFNAPPTARPALGPRADRASSVGGLHEVADPS